MAKDGYRGGLGDAAPPHQHLRYFLSIILCIIGAEQVVMCAASVGFIFVENGYYGHFSCIMLLTDKHCQCHCS